MEQTVFGLSTRSDVLQSMVLLEDNSLVCTGWTETDNISEQQTNILVTKFDKNLNHIWDKVIGGSS